MKIKTTYTLSDSRLWSLLVSAFEGGTYYWCEITDSEQPDPIVVDGEDITRYSYAAPISPRGALHIETTEEDEEYGLRHGFIITHERLQAGLQIMADKYPGHFADIVNENDDATTGDVMIQCAVFGEIIFG